MSELLQKDEYFDAKIINQVKKLINDLLILVQGKENLPWQELVIHYDSLQQLNARLKKKAEDLIHMLEMMSIQVCLPEELHNLWLTELYNLSEQGESKDCDTSPMVPPSEAGRIDQVQNNLSRKVINTTHDAFISGLRYALYRFDMHILHLEKEIQENQFYVTNCAEIHRVFGHVYPVLLPKLQTMYENAFNDSSLTPEVLLQREEFYRLISPLFDHGANRRRCFADQPPREAVPMLTRTGMIILLQYMEESWNSKQQAENPSASESGFVTNRSYAVKVKLV